MDPKTHPLNGNGNGNGIAPPRGYAMSGKIMLSAIVVLFSVVLFILFLHLYVRYHVYRRQQRRQRRRQRFIFSSSVDHAPSKGLDPAVLSSLSVISFSPDGDVTDEDDAAGECAVCLSDFVDGEKVRVLPRCDHRFHVDCIDMWFCSHSNCPLCRSPVEIEEVTSPIKNSTLCADPTVEIGSGSSSDLDRDPENSSEEEEEEEQLGFWSWILAVRRFLRREARPIPDLERGEAAAAAE